MSYWQGKVALVTGGSSGLGRALAVALARHGARVALAARGQGPLEEAAASLRAQGADVLAVPADVTCGEDVERMVRQTVEHFGGLDLLVNAAGRSGRGEALAVPPEEFQALWELNFLGTVRATQAAMPLLLDSRGHVVNIASLAAKTGARWLGAYPASKFPLAGWSQQLRLELSGRGVHVLLVCCGPVARADAGQRYGQQAQGLPETATQPGAGVKIRAIDPQRLSERILTACRRRRPELVVPGASRLVFALGQLSPRLGDWLVRRLTRGG